MPAPQSIIDARRDGDAVVVDADVGRFRLTAYGKGLVHVAWFPGSDPTPLSMWGLQPRRPDAPALDLVFDDAGWQATLPGLAVGIHREAPFLTFTNEAGETLTGLEMVRATPVHVGGEKTFHVWAAFTGAKGEAYYGLGQHQSDWMDHANWEVSLAHDYKAHGGEIIGVPFLVTNRGYGVVWDNPSRSRVIPASWGRTTWWSEVGEAVSFFLVAGETADDVYAGYRTLAGETPLPPLSALGYIQCKQRYKSQDELMEVAKTYREKGYPCDMLVVDWFHWQTLGDMDFNPAFWPDPAGMNRELAAMGYRVMISCWPRFMKDSRHYAVAAERGWFMRDADGEVVYGTPDDRRGALLDTTNPACGEWYWRLVRDSYGARGFSSWWTDENEPDVNPHPFYFHAGSGARLHNLYPYTHSKALYDGHRRDRDDRCLILSRSAYHGAQACGTTFWSSDIHPTWDVFRRQIPCGLNFCATGFAWWSSDIGGWHGRPELDVDDESYKSLLLDTPDRADASGGLGDYIELYVRWFQYGAFCPTFRAHGTRKENEVWSFGEEAERILVAFLRLRYRLLPYIYSLARRVTRTGAPFMRALFMDFPGDPNVRDIKDAYMFGPAFLVAPVTEPGARTREVYLPAGADWFDYWTGARHAGGQTVVADAPLDRMPLFVRAGSIVPTGEVVPHTGAPQTDITVNVYEGADARFELYRDDGVTYAYERGVCTITPLAWDDAAKTLHVEADPEGLFDRPESEYLKRIS